MVKIKRGDLVYYKDEPDKDPFIVHDISGKDVSLSLREYPDTEQDFWTPKSKINKFRGEELKKAKSKIKKMM